MVANKKVVKMHADSVDIIKHVIKSDMEFDYLPLFISATNEVKDQIEIEQYLSGKESVYYTKIGFINTVDKIIPQLYEEYVGKKSQVNHRYQFKVVSTLTKKLLEESNLQFIVIDNFHLTNYYYLAYTLGLQLDLIGKVKFIYISRSETDSLRSKLSKKSKTLYSLFYSLISKHYEVN